MELSAAPAVEDSYEEQWELEDDLDLDGIRDDDLEEFDSTIGLMLEGIHPRRREGILEQQIDWITRADDEELLNGKVQSLEQRVLKLEAQQVETARRLETTRRDLRLGRETLYRLRLHRQGAVPVIIAQLPVEILSMILELNVADWELAFPHVPDWHTLTFYLQSITLVSRYWRNAALKSARLWRNVLHSTDVSKLRLAKIMPWSSFAGSLELTGSVCLNIWTLGYSAATEVLQHLAPVGQIHRIRALHMSRSRSDDPITDLIPCLLEHDYSSLNILSLDCRGIALSSLISCLKRCSQIRSLRINHAWAERDVSVDLEDKAVLSELRSLHIEHYDTQRVQETLSILGALKLRHLFVAVDQEGLINASLLTVPSLIMPTVRELIIGGAMNDRDIRALQSYTPNAEVLHVFKVERPGYLWDSLLQYYLETSRSDGEHASVVMPRLHTLNLHRISVTFTAINSFLDDRANTDAARMKAVGFDNLMRFSDEELKTLSAKADVFECHVLPDIEGYCRVR